MPINDIQRKEQKICRGYKTRMTPMKWMPNISGWWDKTKTKKCFLKFTAKYKAMSLQSFGFAVSTQQRERSWVKTCFGFIFLFCDTVHRVCMCFLRALWILSTPKICMLRIILLHTISTAPCMGVESQVLRCGHPLSREAQFQYLSAVNEEHKT